jgi:hypothetical protein
MYTGAPPTYGNLTNVLSALCTLPLLYMLNCLVLCYSLLLFIFPLLAHSNYGKDCQPLAKLPLLYFVLLVSCLRTNTAIHFDLHKVYTKYYLPLICSTRHLPFSGAAKFTTLKESGPHDKPVTFDHRALFETFPHTESPQQKPTSLNPRSE